MRRRAQDLDWVERVRLRTAGEVSLIDLSAWRRAHRLGGPASAGRRPLARDRRPRHRHGRRSDSTSSAVRSRRSRPTRALSRSARVHTSRRASGRWSADEPASRLDRSIRQRGLGAQATGRARLRLGRFAASRGRGRHARAAVARDGRRSASTMPSDGTSATCFRTCFRHCATGKSLPSGAHDNRASARRRCCRRRGFAWSTVLRPTPADVKSVLIKMPVTVANAGSVSIDLPATTVLNDAQARLLRTTSRLIALAQRLTVPTTSSPTPAPGPPPAVEPEASEPTTWQKVVVRYADGQLLERLHPGFPRLEIAVLVVADDQRRRRTSAWSCRWRGSRPCSS